LAKKCSQCGEPIKLNSQFCENCGASIAETLVDQSDSINEEYLNPKNKKQKKKKLGKIIVIIFLIVFLLIALFVGAIIFIFSSLDANLETSDFMGYYSGELWITDITVYGEEDIAELMEAMKDIRMPMVVEIQEDEIYEGKFIVKNPDTLEDVRIFTYGGEYDQIYGDAEIEGGELLFLEGIVGMDQEPFEIEGYIDLANDETMEITAEFRIMKVDELAPIDSSEYNREFEEVMNAYFEKMITDGFEEMDLDDPSLIENNDVESSFLENNQDENLIPDEGLPSVKQSTVTGTWALNDGYGESFIIFDEGEYYDPDIDWTYTWEEKGYALFYLDEEVEVVPYEIQADMIMIYYEAYGNESEYYIKNNDMSHQLIFNTLDQYGDIDYTKVEIIEKDIPSDMNKELILAIEVQIDESNETLDGILHVDFLNGNVVDTNLTGFKIQ
jgi:hypothetical protein